jgi:hypothetical protein
MRAFISILLVVTLSFGFILKSVIIINYQINKTNIIAAFCINKDNGAYVNIDLKADEVKREIKRTIVANQAVTKIKDWDGFVGDIPTDAKKALSREAKLNDLGI